MYSKQKVKIPVGNMENLLKQSLFRICLHKSQM